MSQSLNRYIARATLNTNAAREYPRINGAFIVRFFVYDQWSKFSQQNLVQAYHAQKGRITTFSIDELRNFLKINCDLWCGLNGLTI